MQARILGLIHHTHPAATQLLDDAVMGDGLSDEGVGVRHSAAILGLELGQVNEPSCSADGIAVDADVRGIFDQAERLTKQCHLVLKYT